MKHLMKLAMVLLGYVLWVEILRCLVGADAAFGAFLMQAIYCRLRYFRNSQMIPTLIPEVVNEH